MTDSPIILKIQPSGRTFISCHPEHATTVIGGLFCQELHTSQPVDVELPVELPADTARTQACLSQRDTSGLTQIRSSDLRTYADGSNAVVVSFTRWLSVRQTHRHFVISCQF